MSTGSPDTLSSLLDKCAEEPIRVPGSIQPHGILLALDPQELIIRQLSENAAHYFGVSSSPSLLGRTLSHLIGDAQLATLRTRLARFEGACGASHLGSFDLSRSGKDRADVIVHLSQGLLIVELELREETSDAELDPDIYSLVDSFTSKIEGAASLEEMCTTAATEVRRLTDFDRVLIYRFDNDWNGIVVGEDGNGKLPEYLNHRFPAHDIPAQARELYRLNRVRIIPNAGYEPVRIIAAASQASSQPLDLTFAVLRSVSPVHLEYMKNMETLSSMSISILREGRLWGLISCHHRTPKYVPFALRGACDLFARAFSLKLSALERSADYERRIAVRASFSKLLSSMAGHDNFVDALQEQSQTLLEFVDATGAAVLTADRCVVAGECPDETQIRKLAGWVRATASNDLYFTDSLSTVCPPAEAYKDIASGLLAISISKLHSSYVFWFRPETVQTVKWGGNPHSHTTPAGLPDRLHPRRSFETWKEVVRNRALPWDSSEIEGADELRNSIVGTVLKKAEERAELTTELLRSNKELEAFSYSVSHDLRAPLRHIVGYTEMLRDELKVEISPQCTRYIATILESGNYAGVLVDKLLSYSRLGRTALQLFDVDMNILVDDLVKEVMEEAGERTIHWKIPDSLPTVAADLVMLRLAIRNLLSNAVKFTGRRERAEIELGVREEESEFLFFIKDNGIGFDMKYSEKLFGVFQRLHRWEDFEGTGIGLANVRRIIERHGGRTWADAEEEKGATFYFTLPRPYEPKSTGALC